MYDDSSLVKLNKILLYFFLLLSIVVFMISLINLDIRLSLRNAAIAFFPVYLIGFAYLLLKLNLHFNKISDKPNFLKAYFAVGLSNFQIGLFGFLFSLPYFYLIDFLSGGAND